MRAIFSFMIAAVTITAVPGSLSGIAIAARSAPIAPQPARFDAFFATFREAVLADDRNAVASMTRLPFADFRAGNYCESGDTACKGSPGTLTSRDRAAFFAKYDRIFTPAVVAAIGASHLRGFRPGDDGGEAGGPIAKREHLPEAQDVGDQRVFVPVGGNGKLARVPFYS